MNESKTDKKHSAWKYMNIIGGTAILILTAFFLIAIIEIITGWFELFQNNFIIQLIKIHAEIIDEELLVGINSLDMTILILFTIMTITLYPVLNQINKAWTIIALSQPFIGITLFIITQEPGRTVVFSTGLTISIIFLRSDIFNKKIAYIGILANSLLLIQDLSLAFFYSIVMGIIMSIGYIILILFYILIAWKLYILTKVGITERKN